MVSGVKAGTAVAVVLLARFSAGRASKDSMMACALVPPNPFQTIHVSRPLTCSVVGCLSALDLPKLLTLARRGWPGAGFGQGSASVGTRRWAQNSATRGLSVLK